MNVIALAPPKPGETYTVPIPGTPTEQQAVDTAVNYGWLIAVVLVAAVVLGAVRYVTKRIDFRLLVGLAAVGFVAYQVGKGH